MQPRFVIIPAVPIEHESFRIGTRSYAATTSAGFDLYDNQDKTRLKRGFSTRSAGEAECLKMNAESRNPEELFPISRTE
ncbi:hypothetical protein [Pseudomonas putida]|uniref:hypothetical protein n=1 Tax=Pseudomonas putida TaxID=303 RepID=UPI0021AB93E2|nr:hypothetical protein [Pseudomonas putida]